MRFFFATRHKPLSTFATLSRGLRAVYSVPDDLPDVFAKVFEKLDSGPKLKPVIKGNPEKKSA